MLVIFDYSLASLFCEAAILLLYCLGFCDDQGSLFVVVVWS